MPTISQILTKNINNFEVNVFEVDIQQEAQKQLLEQRLIEQIKKIKAFKNIDQVVNSIKTPGITNEFIEKLKQSLISATKPADNQIPAFDVKRSYITEFMSQLVLEKHYQCFFYEEADRRLKSDQWHYKHIQKELMLQVFTKMVMN